MIKLSKRYKQEAFNLAFLAPALFPFIFVVAIPFLKGITYSFTNWDGIAKSYKFIGLENYSNIFSDSTILNPIKNSIIFTVLTVILNNAVGLMLALALNRDGRVVKALRTVFFMPFVISLVLAGFIWTYIYGDVIYSLFHIESILGNPQLVMIGIALISVWRDSGYVMIIYLAGLQSIPDEYYEAGKVDGAGPVRRFFTITLPMLIPAIIVNVTLYIGWGLKVFDYIMAATKGGPGDASETMAFYVYNYTFPYNRAGYGQAAAIVMMIGIFIVTAFVARFFRRKEIEM